MTDLRTLAYASGTRVEEIAHWRELIALDSGYKRALIPQRRRRPREVCMPSVGLDRLLKQLRGGIDLTTAYEAPREVHGFVPGRGIVSNASQHLGQDVVLKVDLRDFFGAIGTDKLTPALGGFGFDVECSTAIAGVALIDGSLAQGFSTSPLLSNLAFLESDRKIAAHAGRFNVTYTRYVDDLIFSGQQAIVTDEFLKDITSLLTELGWQVNDSKTRFMRRGRPQFVTGLYVGDVERPHIPRAMKRLLRREVHFAAKYGIEDAHLKSPTPIDPDRLGGWVHYAANADPLFGQQLRADWRVAIASRTDRSPGHDWTDLLDDIDFPTSW